MLRPDYAEVYYNRGNVLTALKRFDEALTSYDRVLALQPVYVDALCNRGNVLHEVKRFEEALTSYDRALALRPDYAQIHSNRGNVLMALRRFEDALASYDRALALQPDYVEAHSNRGNALKALKRFAEALTSYNRALMLRSDYAEAYSNRGNVLQELTRFEDALASYDLALKLRPDYVEAHCNRGNALMALERLEEALASYDRALAQRPNFADAHCSRGNALHQLKRFAEALTSYDRALMLRSDYAEAHSNRGNVLMALRRFEDALASYDRALKLQPDYAEAYSNRGNALEELRRFEDALASYDRALELRPDFVDAHFNAALCRLLIGDFARGWQEHEWRWETAQMKARKPNFPQPLWLGADDIAGKTILLHAEQGFGDTLLVCRYVPLVVARGARVILGVPNALRELTCTLPCVVRIVSSGDPLPAFDLHCPLLSLPLAFGTRLETIPSQTPYLSAADNKRNAWRDRLGKHERARIGLVWAGDPRKHVPDANRFDRQRSLQFDQLAPVLQVRGCEFYSLQKGEDAVAQLHDSALPHGVVDWSVEFHDFSDTAAVIANLDLVITIDTAVAHLAGALGKPVWVIHRYNTCWRWLLDREDSPWYPTARLFRQDATRDWGPVIARVAAALQDHVRNF